MSLQLIATAGGLMALVVNRRLIILGDKSDDSGVMVQTAADNLSKALGYQVENLHENLSVEDLIARYNVTAPAVETTPVCAKCGNKLRGGVCGDETCPYSDWPQQVSIEDIEGMCADEIVATYRLIRAEAHSDDHVHESNFFAEGWFISASDDQIKTLAYKEWGCCETADTVAHSAEKTPKVIRMFEYIHARNACTGERIGFECTINPKDAMAWLRRQRYGLWAQLVCEEHGVRIVEAQEPAVKGMFDWCTERTTCDTSFICADEAAMDAVKCLGLDPHAPVTPLYYAFWDVGAFYSPSGTDTRQILGPALFCGDLGYGEDDIEDIAALAVGEVWESPDFGPYHTVLRIR